MRFEFSGEIFEWRGPAPHQFVALPQQDSDELKDEVASLSYGWGCIPVEGRIGETSFTTSLMPKDGRYLVPIKLKVRQSEGLDLGDTVRIEIQVGSEQ